MKNGEIEQIGTADEIYNDPIDRYVANFIGDSNLFSGVVIDRNHVLLDGKEFSCDETLIEPNTQVDLLLRPEDLDIVEPEKANLLVSSMKYSSRVFSMKLMSSKMKLVV